MPAALTEALLDSGTTGVAYETTEDMQGRLPLLAPMSAVAGSMAPIVGAYHLARFNGGRGMLLGKILGRPYGRVMIVGDGVVGRHAASVAAAMGAEVNLFGLEAERGAALRAEISQNLNYVVSTPESLAAHARDSDLLVGAVLVEGARAPHLISSAMVSAMPEGSVIVDVSIDQGGCVETSTADVALRADVRRARSYSLLCYEHAGGLPAYVNVRVDRRDAAVCVANCRSRPISVLPTMRDSAAASTRSTGS